MSKMYRLERLGKLGDIGGGYAEGTYDVVENETGLVIKHQVTSTKAKHLVKKLNGGCGFRGMTPLFFLESKG